MDRWTAEQERRLPSTRPPVHPSTCLPHRSFRTQLITVQAVRRLTADSDCPRFGPAFDFEQFVGVGVHRRAAWLRATPRR